MVSTGVGARNGILMKNAEAIELANKTKYVLFDKTGTLTEGVINLAEVIPFGSYRDTDLLSIAFNLERHSEHPFSEALRKKAEEIRLPALAVDGFEAVVGKGIMGNIEGKRYYVGNLSLLADAGRSIDEQLKDLYRSKEREAASPVLVFSDTEVIGILTFSDRVRDESMHVISELAALNIGSVMITGDSEAGAEAIARKTGITDFQYRVLPDKKAEVVEQYKKKGITMMVGDGINDAPSLATADIGVAMGKGTDIAIESADVVLMKGQLSRLVSLIRLSKKTLWIIRENLFWAFIYNVLGIPIAFGLLYPFFGIRLEPIYGALAMMVSSVSVVTNSLRLKLFKG